MGRKGDKLTTVKAQKERWQKDAAGKVGTWHFIRSEDDSYGFDLHGDHSCADLNICHPHDQKELLKYNGKLYDGYLQYHRSSIDAAITRSGGAIMILNQDALENLTEQ